jgi:Putative peptidoglycan binding domain
MDPVHPRFVPGSLTLKRERRTTLPWHCKIPRTRNGRETEEKRPWNMKRLILLGLVGITSVAFAQAGWAAGRGGGGGGGFHGGGFGGGGGFHGGGFGRGGAAHVSPGARFSFGARPVYGRPVYARSGSGSIAPSARATTAFNRQQNRITTTGNRSEQASRSPVAQPTDQRVMSASNHIFARHDTNWQRDWDHHSAHYRNGHWWCYDGSAWIGLDTGYYPWDYYPYYAYDYYPYDYYPGYYADVEPEYYNAGVSSSVDQSPEPNVTAVQTDLTQLGYYHGAIDGFFGRDTRDALARYQTDQHLIITGTLTTETLQSLGV